MKKKSVKHLLHFMLLCMPLLLLLIACIFPTKQINNTYKLEETTTTQEIQYKYQTNEVNSINDLVVGNVYKLDISTTATYLISYSVLLNDFSHLDILSYYSANGYEHYLPFVYSTGNGSNVVSILVNNVRYVYLCSDVLYFVYYDYYIRDASHILGLSSLTDEEMNIYVPKTTINNITNNSYNQEALTQVNETKQPNEAILMPYKTFYNLSVNDWYRSLLDLIGVDISSSDLVQGYLLYFPLWAMWFWLFELIELAVTLVPKLVYEIYQKLSRSKDE